jgi:predicted TIM-barrel fold metal-dependent hydrolase
MKGGILAILLFSLIILASCTPHYECDIPKTVPIFEHTNYYTGKLIDTHVHMPVASKIVSKVATSSGFEGMPAFDDELSIGYVDCLMESEGIEKVFGFNVAPNMQVSTSVRKVEKISKKYPRFINFYMPTPLKFLDPSTSRVEEVFERYPDLFKGYGEVKFDFHEVDNAGIRDPKWLRNYEFAEEHGLIIQMHPAKNQKEDVKFLLEKHPSVNFLLHGEIESWIVELIRDYPNAYTSLDANLNHMYGWDQRHSYKSATKEEYLEYMKTNFDIILADELRRWKPLIEKYPDKFTWGTDRWYRQHWDREVGAMVEEFSRAFIGSLDPEVQEKFAYGNADNILDSKNGGDEI